MSSNKPLQGSSNSQTDNGATRSTLKGAVGVPMTERWGSENADEAFCVIETEGRVEKNSGKVYVVKCTECSYQEAFFLGIGEDDTGMTEKAICNVEAGIYGEEARAFKAMAGHNSIECQRMLYRCRTCGNLEVNVKIRLIAQNGYSFSQPYFCSKCGKLLGQVKPADIKKQACPLCGKPIQVVSVSDWDTT